MLTQAQNDMIVLLTESRDQLRKVGIPPEMDYSLAKRGIEETAELIDLLISVVFTREPTQSLIEGVKRARAKVDVFRSMFTDYEETGNGPY